MLPFRTTFLWLVCAACGLQGPAASAQSPGDGVVPTVEAAEAEPAAAGMDDQKIRLEFQQQGWLPVLQWLAEKRNLNLDWQQLPEGSLNFSSATEYNIEEAEDLINMQLLARGYTLLHRGEVLRLASLKNIDITLVPRVDAEELERLPPHKFVRVTFPLEWMLAEEAAAEFKPLVSPYGQLLPMATSNRLEAMDAVVNLRELHRLLTRAEADETRRERVEEFRLKHRKAKEVAVSVRVLLGLPAEETPTATTQNQLDIETVKFRSEAVKQLGTEAQKFLVDRPSLHLVVNDKENSILVNGRPDKIEIVRQAIEAMDQPEPPTESSWQTLNKVKTYAVDGFDPTTVSNLMQALQERGNLSKETQIEHEAAYNRLVVVASPADQLTIASIIDSFRTEGRRAEVVELERLDAQYAANAIKLVLKNPARPSAGPGPASEGQFQIEPDPANRRLLLWATPAESAEVREFLTRLGESFASGRIGRHLHVVHLRTAKPADVIDRLHRVWKEISDAPLVVEAAGKEQSGESPASSTPQASPQTDTSPTGPPPQPMSDHKPAAAEFRLATHAERAASQAGAPVAESSPDSNTVPASDGPSPVRVIADDTDMIIVSQDAAAADIAKKFIEQIVPDSADIQVIPLKNAQAGLVKTQLESLLAHTNADSGSLLRTQPPLVLDADTRTNRLIIQHATPKQMELINQVIPQLDQPAQEDERLVRRQEIYRAERRRASEIAEVVKEVFRDLLSTSDKAFDASSGNRPFGYTRAMAATSKSPEYQGLLSVGVDNAGNTLILSAPAYLMEEVMRVVKLVDTQSGGEAVVVVPVARAARQNVQAALDRLLEE
jgi:type II secretory pathway component GspD/PulD (secretin)